MKATTTAAALLLVSAAWTYAADWPQWRGPDRTGISGETGWKSDFSSASPKVLWEAQVGLGFSTFVAGEGRVYATGHAGGQDTVFCFEADTGKQIWKFSYPAELGDKYFEGGTTGTPTLADGALYHLSRWGDMIKFDAATGKILWQRNVDKEHGLTPPEWGYSGSPLVWEGLLILNVGKAGMALKKEDGSLVWKSEDGKAGYSTPFPYDVDGKTAIILGTGRSYLAVEARTGKELWEHRWNTSYGVNAADPILHNGYAFISSGYNKGSAMLKLDGAEPSEIWTTREMRSQMNAAMLVGDYLYGIDGNENHTASLKCLDFKTGKPVWEEPSIGFGAVIVADGKLLGLSAKGELFIAPATPEGFKPTTRVKVLEGKCWAVPVLSNGLLFVRDAQGTVKCLDLKA